ncbi:TIGR03086 family metal-binding protein [Nocardia sp. NBC_01503]|uniref:TIGR03086 family metal-binding protein n=1 Tax=Nocardia sp. NBC_01503 TaxID=2975997 RepID=UPI002E7BFC39|nr:TIGR03086 family metal-binding protein [Nocardia sp. NBC_01503]WTL32210.1 TIGR03086 family metal-binding protein [Nocardia sp. NBC_01503]
MITLIDRIDAAITTTGGIVDSIPVAALSARTPCAGWDVRTELNHLVGGMRIFAAELTGIDAGGEHESDWLTTDHHVAYRTAAALDRAAWQRPDALATNVRLGFGTVPGTTAALIHLTEVLVHGIDLAVAAGHEDLIDQRAAAELLEIMRGMDFDAFRQPGMFGPDVSVPAAAPAHRRLLAFTGRSALGAD